MIIKKVKELYICEYCRKAYQVKRFCIKHEKYCYKNPRNHHKCFGCKFLKVGTTDVFYSDSADYSRPGKTFNCTNKECSLYKKHLFTFKLEKMIENKNMGALDFSDAEGEEDISIMPNGCKFYKSEFVDIATASDNILKDITGW